MRILHTSDWHLGRLFHGVHLTDDQAHILEQFVRLVADVKPDCILIAGDVYDRAVPPTEAVRLLDDILTKIIWDYKVPTIVIAGNHDSPERLSFGTRILAERGLYIVGHVKKDYKPIVLEDKHGEVFFCPIPYAEPAIVREKLGGNELFDHNFAMSGLAQHAYSYVPTNKRSIAIAHAFIAGGEESESERPLSVGGSGSVDYSSLKPFNYVALGHLHRSQQAGAEHIRYAGSLMKYSFAEATHKKAINLIEIDGAGELTIEAICLTPRRDVRCIEGHLEDILYSSRASDNKNDYLLVSLQDTGAVLDAMGKLRQVYPNVLHIERPHLKIDGKIQGPKDDHRRLGELDLFTSFFQQVTGEELSSDQNKVFSNILEQLQQQEREVG